MPTELTDVTSRVTGRWKSEGGNAGVRRSDTTCVLGRQTESGPLEYSLTCMTLRKSVSYNIRWL